MKNILLSLLIAIITLSSFSNLHSQSLELVKPTTVPDTITGEPDDWELTSSPIIKNVSNQDVTLRMVVAPSKLTTGHLFAFCDLTTCYPPTSELLEAPNTFTLKPNEDTGEWIHVYLYPNNSQGTSELSVRIYNVDNPEDDISYKAIYFVGTSDVSDNIIFNNLKIYPNPATDYITIDLKDLTADKIIISDINGKQIYKTTLNGEKFITIVTNNFNSGTYIYTIISKGTVKATGNLTITR